MAIENVNTEYDGAFCFSQGAMVFQLIFIYHKLGIIKWKSFENIKFFMNFSSASLKISLSIINW